MKVTRVKTIRKTVVEDITPEEIVEEIVDSVNFFDYDTTDDKCYEEMFEDGLNYVQDEVEISDEDIPLLKSLTIEKLKETKKSRTDNELKLFLKNPYYIAQLMEYLNEDLQRDFEFINSDTPEVRETIIKYLQEK
jgi:hypothetical protein